MTTEDFLLEIGTEELPPHEIPRLIQALASFFKDRLVQLRLAYQDFNVFAAPRRLAILISGLVTQQPDQEMVVKGPAVKIAFDASGEPTMAALKFAASHATTVEQLVKVSTPKGDFLYYQAQQKGVPTLQLLSELMHEAICKLPCKRAMYWGEHLGPFVRPLRWLVALFGEQIVPCEVFGIHASRETFGHRFLANHALTIMRPNEYVTQLAQEGYVLVDPAQRLAKIQEQMAMQTPPGAQVVLDPDLLQEVVNLVEWPAVMFGNFAAEFLKIPQEVLITTLKNHQRCFAVRDAAGKLKPQFVIISNIESSSREQAIHGFERVIQARFADAAYFYRLDTAHPLADNLPKLKQVMFQDGLGSLYDKSLRVAELAAFLGRKFDLDEGELRRAAQLAKCDLTSSMVGEFPELQGIMGGYYAASSETVLVATAVREQYLPNSAGGPVASSLAGALLVIADRIDTLVGAAAMQRMPTGDKDPLGLRRAAVAVIRTILEHKLAIDLPEFLQLAATQYAQIVAVQPAMLTQLLQFIYDRLARLRPELMENINVYRAVTANFPGDLCDLLARFAAVKQLLLLPQAAQLMAMYKRIKNILERGEQEDLSIVELCSDLLQSTAERELLTQLQHLQKEAQCLFAARRYADLLQLLLQLADPLEQFFQDTMVLVDDHVLRVQRLKLLYELRVQFARVAEFTLVIEGTK